MKLEPDKHLHSREHVLADDITRMMKEPKRFAAYLGIAKLYYESDLRALARRVLEKEDLPIEARGKYFFAALKGLAKKPGVKFKNLRRKKGNKSPHLPSGVLDPAGRISTAPIHPRSKLRYILGRWGDKRKRGKNNSHRKRTE
ncbi:MAG: hypothetical protein HYW89_04705 [Candidatus Sungiibacteriota bacterium]|uniref:Uncharacterized protein n=1 Tax=Candidatus Sungiibacteriota bacterium TaxID=2750080 RepID=A0A7T5RJE8_9BACT|nr:MAG: hypothetical protein HYW89_04705 [Candidatus Sungbacteria bacterium]